MGCTMCPRRCGADRRAGQVGYCGASDGIRVAKVMLHPWEEPCLIHGPGSGAIFFGGCPLHCVYCQNKAISHGDVGEIWDTARLGEEILRLAEAGASCIDLVSPTQYATDILTALGRVKDRLTIPVVWNTGGYETVDTIHACRGLVDVFLTDFKYGTAETAEKYSAAPDYVTVARDALTAMVEDVGDPVWDGDRLTRGVILRHLVLPGCRRDSEAALTAVADAIDPESVILSLMRQYTPDFAPEEFPALRRRVTTFEYEYVRDVAVRLGFGGYSQDADSATAAYTPEF